MYSIYMSKYKNDKADFEIVKVIEEYINFYFQKNNSLLLVMSPGYMSVTENTAKTFWERINQMVPDRNKMKIILFNGMNGANKNDLLGMNRDALTQCNKLIWKEIEDSVEKTSRDDHRKMIFFIDDKQTEYDTITVDLLKKLYPQAILIGSTNQSRSSYMGDSNNVATHGEADMLLFNDKNFAMNMVRRVNKKMIVFEEMYDTQYPDEKCIQQNWEGFSGSVFSEFIDNSMISKNKKIDRGILNGYS